MDKRALQSFIAGRMSLAQADWLLIEKLFRPIVFKEGDFLLEEGAICRHLFFLKKGLIRFFFWRDGEDHTKYFATEDSLLTSAYSFSRQAPAQESMQALEDCELYRISYDDLQILYTEVPGWRLFIQGILREVQHYTDQLLMEVQTETAENRYRRILQEEPELLQRIPLKYLASYLGIAPQSLSRIRKRMLLNSRT